MDIDDIKRLMPRLMNDSHAAVAIKSPDGVYLFANREYARYASVPGVDFTGRRDEDFFAAERMPTVLAAERSAIDGQTSVRCDERFAVDGEAMAYLSTRFPIFDEVRRMVGLGVVAMDITQHQRCVAEAELALRSAEQANAHLRGEIEMLARLASTDRLTGTWNRRRLEEAIEAETHRANRYGQPLSLLIVDIDHFKGINDTHGHLTGDRVLREVAESIRTTMRKSDSLTRWGGEEFIVLMPNTALPAGRRLGERIRAQIAAQPVAGVGSVTASIGVAEYLPSAPTSEWLDRADHAMYRAKHDGRNRVEADSQRAAPEVHDVRLEGAFVQLVWKNTFQSGNYLIDAQHQSLFVLANELLEAILTSRPHAEVRATVNRLLEEVVQHFQDEERILCELSFPDLDHHTEEHARLINQGLEMAQAFDEGRLTLGNVFQFLAYDVVTRHLLGADRNFFPYIASRAAAELE